MVRNASKERKEVVITRQIQIFDCMGIIDMGDIGYKECPVRGEVEL